jgi:hypothetical protein
MIWLWTACRLGAWKGSIFPETPHPDILVNLTLFLEMGRTVYLRERLPQE